MCYNIELYEQAIFGAPSQATDKCICRIIIFKEDFTMPNIKSAKKRVKVIATKTLRNKMLKSQLNTAIKKFKAAVESGDKEAAQVAYVALIKRIDKAVAQGILHKNNAAHKKSQFTLMYNKMA